MDAAAPRRVGVFGGAFDPPHVAHRALVEAALDQLQLDLLHLIPTGQAWHKARDLSPARHRLAMAELAFGDIAGVRVDARETLRSGPTYTVDTLRELRAEYPAAELLLVIGEDQARALPSWHEWRAVLALAVVCVAGRAADGARAGEDFMPPAEFADRFRVLRLPDMPVSATDIRTRAARGLVLAPLVDDTVARYIVLHHLYQGP